MNYSDFTEINEDYVTGKVYGNCVVLGWNGKQHGKKLYILQCNICKEDSELFGDGLFVSGKSNLDKGQIPCGCSSKPVWTKEQLELRLKREATSRGYTFHKLSDNYKKATTKVVLECNSHGVWGNMQANAFLSGQDCPACSMESRLSGLSKHQKYIDSELLKTFIDLYPDGTEISKSNIKDARGSYSYWDVYCKNCNVTYYNTTTALSNGRLGCNCKTLPQQAYINLVKDEDNVIALKFGIARNSYLRKYKNCIYEYELYGYWEFQTYQDCKLAEKACKNILTCSVLPKEEMPDGYTETTLPFNIDKIISIYESYGGQKVEIEV